MLGHHMYLQKQQHINGTKLDNWGYITIYRGMEQSRVAYLGLTHPGKGAPSVSAEHPAVLPRLCFSVKDMWSHQGLHESVRSRQDALLTFIRKEDK